jgi:prophage maintenance system killer protein
MSKKQLFPNGNKRTALCFSNLILIDKDIDFIQINNRIEYTNKLIDFYDDEDKINNFIEEVKKQTQNGEYALDVEKEKNR